MFAKLGKRAVTPIVITTLLIGFAIALGSIVMTFGGSVNYEENASVVQSQICIEQPQEPMKQLMMDYINDKITLLEYYQKEELIKQVLQN